MPLAERTGRGRRFKDVRGSEYRIRFSCPWCIQAQDVTICILHVPSDTVACSVRLPCCRCKRLYRLATETSYRDCRPIEVAWNIYR